MEIQVKLWFRAIIGATLLVGVLGVPGVQAVAALPSGPSPGPSIGVGDPLPEGKHCRVVLDKLRPGEKISRVLSRTCADRQESLNINQDLLIMTWYQDLNYGGLSTVVEGAYGPCDANGYGIRDTGAWVAGWRNIITSYKVWNNCYYSLYYTAINYGGDGSHPVHEGNNSYVGDHFNDRVRSILIWGPN
ncbi:hypothetical protein [Streptosporangium sp. NPDC002721]|uniref:hypothetical protein n=1 Tax=Streptosporangium sp. NPDC002721 TaxID=3366188 RepID=UPI0036D1CF67